MSYTPTSYAIFGRDLNTPMTDISEISGMFVGDKVCNTSGYVVSILNQSAQPGDVIRSTSPTTGVHDGNIPNTSQGPKGDKGDKGDAGAQGPAGKDGANAVGTVLWSNPTPTVNPVVGSTITLSSDNYDYLEVEFSTSVGSNISGLKQRFSKGSEILISFSAGDEGVGDYVRYRKLSYINPTTFIIGDAFQAGGNYSNKGPQLVPPLKITGYKNGSEYLNQWEEPSNTVLATSKTVALNGNGLELAYTTPFIDFHFNRDPDDYSTRIINDTINTFDFRAKGAISGQGIIKENGIGLQSKYVRNINFSTPTYCLTCNVSSKSTIRVYVEVYSTNPAGSRQSLFIFGSDNGRLILGIIQVASGNTATTFVGVGSNTVSATLSGNLLTINLPIAAYDQFILMSGRNFIYID